MTYRDEIVDEVRAIREQLCNQAGCLDNLLAKLRAEEAKHAGRVAKNVDTISQVHKSDVKRIYQINRKQKTVFPMCAEDSTKYGGK